MDLIGGHLPGLGGCSVNQDGTRVVYADGFSSGDSIQIVLEDRSNPMNRQRRIITRGAAGEMANNDSFSPQMTDDGNFIFFISLASNLPGGSSSQGALYVYDVRSSTINRVSLSPRFTFGANHRVLVTEDLNYLVFSATLVESMELPSQVYRLDRRTGEVILISTRRDGMPGNGRSSLHSVSTDGRRVLISSLASDLLGPDQDDRNNREDIFLWRAEDPLHLERISVASDGSEANGRTERGSMNRRGDRIVISTRATNLATGSREIEELVGFDLRTGQRALLTPDPCTGSRRSHFIFLDKGTPLVDPQGEYVVADIELHAEGGPSASNLNIISLTHFLR